MNPDPHSRRFFQMNVPRQSSRSPQPKVRTQALDAIARFNEWIWPHRALVLRTARLLVGPQDAEDLAQEALMRAFAGISSFTPREDGTGVKAWLLRILRNTHIDRARHRARRIDDTADLPAALVAPATVTETPHVVLADFDALLQQFSDTQLIDALQSLPHDIAWTLILVDVEELDHAAAAELLEVPVGTVKSRAFRGRQMLRDALVHRSPGGPQP